MVTAAEFAEHLLVSGAVMGLGLAVVAFVRFKCGVGERVFRRLTTGYVLCLGLVAALSLTSNVTERRCTRDLLEFCRYNDGVPFMAVLVFVFFVTCLLRAFFLHFNR